MKRLFLLLLLALPTFGQHAWWRASFTQGSPSAISIAEFKFFDGGASQIATTGGTPLASSTVAGTAASAFDGNSATFWASNGCSNPCTEWLQYHFASNVTPASFTIQTRSDAGFQIPYDLTIRYSDNGSTWGDFYQYFGIPWTNTNGETVTLDSAHSAPLNNAIGISWRLLITADAAGQSTSIAEWKLFDTSSAQINTSSQWAAITSSTVGEPQSTGTRAFDGSLSTYWASGPVPSVGVPQWLGFRFASGSVSPATFSITARNNVGYPQAPTAFSLQYSTDESTWITIQTYTSATWTTGNQVQTFSGVQRARHRVNTE